MNEDLSAPQLELEFPSKPEYIRTARHAAAALARVQGIPENVIDDLKLVVSEACTQAVAANLSTGEDIPVRLVVSEKGGKLTAEVFDRGSRPDLTPADGPATDSSEGFNDGSGGSLAGFPDAGLSFPLIRELVDELEVARREGGGTRVRIVLSREGAR